PERGGCHESLHPILEQRILQRFTLRGVLAAPVGLHVESLGSQEGSETLGVSDRQGVDDATAGQRRKCFSKPGHASRLSRHHDRLQTQALPSEWPTEEVNIRPECRK